MKSIRDRLVQVGECIIKSIGVGKCDRGMYYQINRGTESGIG